MMSLGLVLHVGSSIFFVSREKLFCSDRLTIWFLLAFDLVRVPPTPFGLLDISAGSVISLSASVACSSKISPSSPVPAMFFKTSKRDGEISEDLSSILEPCFGDGIDVDDSRFFEPQTSLPLSRSLLR